MKQSELIKILEAKGCFFIKNGKNHEHWFSPITNRRFQVPRHPAKEIQKGTLESILKQAGLK